MLHVFWTCDVSAVLTEMQENRVLLLPYQKQFLLIFVLWLCGLPSRQAPDRSKQLPVSNYRWSAALADAIREKNLLLAYLVFLQFWFVKQVTVARMLTSHWFLSQPMLDGELLFTPVKNKAQKFAAAETFSDLIVFSPLPPSGEKWVTWDAKCVSCIEEKSEDV